MCECYRSLCLCTRQCLRLCLFLWLRLWLGCGCVYFYFNVFLCLCLCLCTCLCPCLCPCLCVCLCVKERRRDGPSWLLRKSLQQHCTTLQHTATVHCSTLQHAIIRLTPFNAHICLHSPRTHCNNCNNTATTLHQQCNTLQHTHLSTLPLIRASPPRCNLESHFLALYRSVASHWHGVCVWLYICIYVCVCVYRNVEKETLNLDF